MRISLLFSLFLFTSSLSAEIITSNTLLPLKERLNELDADTLVILDVDDTLIYPQDVALRSSTRMSFQRIVQNILQDKGATFAQKFTIPCLNTQIMLQMGYDLVDPSSVAVVKELQTKKIPVIALTASYGGALCGTQSNAEIRVNQLKNVGLEFKEAFPEIGAFEFIIAPGTAFRDGVLFASQYPKGEVLKLFLKTISWKPKKIIFVDDRIDFIQSVEAAARTLQIESLSIHYTAAESITATVDWSLAVEQAHHLAEHGVWLSDSETAVLRAGLAVEAQEGNEYISP